MSNRKDEIVDGMMFSLKNDQEIERYLNLEEEDLTEDNKFNTVIENSDSELVKKIEEGLISSPINEETRPGLYKRMFGKIEPGSIRGSIFNMAILSIGSGCLSLPKAISQMSLVMGLTSLLFTCVSTYFTLYLINITAEKYHIFNYSRLVKTIFGKAVSYFLDTIILIYIFGVLILYQVVIYKILGEVVYDLGGYYSDYATANEFLKDSFWNTAIYKFSIMYGITTFLVMPLCLLKDVSKLRIASLFGIITLMFLIVVIVIQCPFYIQHYWDKVYKENDESTHMNLFNVASGFDEHLFFFQGTAAMFYSFTCHIGAFPIFNSLKNNVNRRIQKVINRTILLDFVIFIIIIVCGFLTWPVNTPELIIERENIAGGKDIIMGIGKIAFIAVMIVKLPSSYNSFRLSFYELIFKNTEITTAKNLLLTIPTLMITVFIGIIYDTILSYIKILGGYFSTIIGYIIPGLIYIKSNEYPLHHWKNLGTMLLILVLASIGFCAGTITILQGKH